MQDTSKLVLEYWFDTLQPVQWFMIDPALDENILGAFENHLRIISELDIEDLSCDTDTCLSSCITLGQFPRRMYRGTQQAYAYDALACKVALVGVMRGYDTILPSEKRFFMYHPIEQSEKKDHQERSLALFSQMQHENPVAYAVAQKRYMTFTRFGRFPERNKALSRENTVCEDAYLKELVS